ncbi:MAG: hypothetical protein WA777_20010 [Rhodanobacter sp.]
MAAGIDWFRWHHGTVTDPKFGLIARRSGASIPDVVAIWAALLEEGSQSSPRGSIASFDAEAFDVLFNFPEPRTASVLEALRDRGLVKGLQLSAWEKRQPKREREGDDSTERVRKHRAGKKGVSSGTPCNASETQETPRVEKSREESLKASLSHSAGEGDCGLLVTDGDGNPSAPPDPAQALGVGVPAAKRLRLIGIRVTALDPTLLALCAEKFTVEDMALLASELVLRKVHLFGDPDVHPELPELLASAATQQQMLLTPAQYASIQVAAADIGINYLATALRRRRQDAIDKQSPSRPAAKNGARRPSATDNFEGTTYVGTAIDKLPPEIRAGFEPRQASTG